MKVNVFNIATRYMLETTLDAMDEMNSYYSYDSGIADADKAFKKLFTAIKEADLDSCEVARLKSAARALKRYYNTIEDWWKPIDDVYARLWDYVMDGRENLEIIAQVQRDIEAAIDAVYLALKIRENEGDSKKYGLALLNANKQVRNLQEKYYIPWNITTIAKAIWEHGYDGALAVLTH